MFIRQPNRKFHTLCITQQIPQKIPEAIKQPMLLAKPSASSFLIFSLESSCKLAVFLGTATIVSVLEAPKILSELLQSLKTSLPIMVFGFRSLTEISELHLKKA